MIGLFEGALSEDGARDREGKGTVRVIYVVCNGTTNNKPHIAILVGFADLLNLGRTIGRGR